MVVALLLAAALAHPTTAQNRTAARREAPALLRRVVLPAGAVPDSRGPLRSPWTTPGLRDLVDRHLFRLVPKPAGAVAAFLKAHPPSGARVSAWGADGIAFDFAPTTRLYSRALVLGLRPQAGGGTAVRVDAQVAWRMMRPAAERVPAAVRQVVLSKPGGTRRVTAPAEVRRIVRWFDALPAVQPSVGVFACPAIYPGRPSVTVEFRGSGGALLARARTPGLEMCGFSIDVRIRGRRQPPLALGTFLERVQRLVGMRLLPRRR